MKNVGNKLIKVLSLGVGLAVSVVLIAKVCFELSYDNYIEDIDNIYEIRTWIKQQGQQGEDYYNVSGAVAPGFQREVPGVLRATRFCYTLGNNKKFYDEDGNQIMADNAFFAADTNFLNIFDRDVLIGSINDVLCAWNGQVAVSESFAEKLGGVQEAYGKIIKSDEAPHIDLSVGAVFEDFPENSTYRADVILSDWIYGAEHLSQWIGGDHFHGYVRVADGVDAKSLDEAIRSMQESHVPSELLEMYGVEARCYLSPLKGSHREQDNVRNQIVILSVIAFLLIAISVLNYVLVAVADVIRRSREVGVRKCYGADESDIHAILIKETAVNLLVSLAVAVAVILGFRSTIEILTDVSLAGMMIPQTWCVVAAAVAVIFLVCAFIPARMLSRIPISTAFRGYKENKRKWKLSLLTFQFAINTFLIILLLVAGSQYRKIINEDVGYNPKNLVYVHLGGVNANEEAAVAKEFRSQHFVEGVELSYTLPFRYSSGNQAGLPGSESLLFNFADQYETSPGFFGLMELRMIEGQPPVNPDEMAVSRSFVDNMMMFADWSDGAVGKNVIVSEHVSSQNNHQFTISGVFEDFRVANALNPEDRPIVYFAEKLYDLNYFYMVARLEDVTAENIKTLNGILERIVPHKDIEVVVYEDTLNGLYDSTRRMRNTFSIGAIIAVIIALFGLVGFVGDETERRSAEIAIRKVNGAQAAEIVRMIVGSVLKLAAVAVVIGDVAVWFAASRWLEQFADKITLTPVYLLVGDIIVIAIIAATVILGSIRIARTNPADELKKE